MKETLKEKGHALVQKAKGNWKKILLWVGILFVLIIAIFATVRLVRKHREKKKLEEQQKASIGTGTGSHSGSSHTHTSSGSSGSGSGSGSTPPPTSAPGPKVLAWSEIMPGDKLIALADTPLYRMGESSPVAEVAYMIPKGQYYGQVTEKHQTGGTVRNWKIPGTDDTLFYMAPGSSFIKQP